MRVALMTPMKPPDSPVPSGDRTFARLIMAALQRAGWSVTLPSRLVTWRATPEGLDDLLTAAEREVDRITALWRTSPPDAVLTYHNYHKAPDLLGPQLADRFGLGYVIVEGSRAAKRATGPWARHFALADAALLRADRVAAVSAHDAAGLQVVGERLVRVQPFVDAHAFDRPPNGRTGTMVASAAMMRPGRKAESVRVLADVVARVQAVRPDVIFRIAGDGPERERLEPLFPRDTFMGALSREGLAALFTASDLFVWPAIDEPFGFTFLEAQAAGLPVVAGRARGVEDVVAEGVTALLTDPRDADALAAQALTLLTDRERRGQMAQSARAFARSNDLNAGAARLTSLFDGVVPCAR